MKFNLVFKSKLIPGSVKFSGRPMVTVFCEGDCEKAQAYPLGMLSVFRNCMRCKWLPLVGSKTSRIQVIVYACLSFALLLLFPSECKAWGGTVHWLITKGAFESLPASQRNFLEPVTETSWRQYSKWPDKYGYKHLNDAKFEHRKYFYTGKKPVNYINIIYKGSHALNTGFFFENTVKEIQDGNPEEAAKYIGVFSHIVGDMSAPWHTLNGDNRVERPKKLLNLPDWMAGVDIHAVGDMGSYPFKEMVFPKYIPVLLGTSEDEVVWNVKNRLLELDSKARKQLIPFIQAFVAHDMKGIMESQTKAAEMSARLLADFIFTSMRFANKKITKSDENKLKSYDLSQIRPLKVKQSRYAASGHWLLPFTKDFQVIFKKRGLWPEKIPLVILDGKKEKEVKGLGAGVSCYANFALPQGAFSFKTFNAKIGVNVAAARKGKCVFYVVGDGKTLYASPPMDLDSPAIDIEVPIEGVKILTLVTYPEKTELNSAKISIPFTVDGSKSQYAVWGSPKLVK